MRGRACRRYPGRDTGAAAPVEGMDPMSMFGLHTFALAPAWDVERIERGMEPFREAGIRLLELPVRRPADIDAAGARGFATRHGLGLVPSVVLPPTVDAIADPQDGVDFLEPVMRLAADLGSFGVVGMVHGTPGCVPGRAPTDREIDGLTRFLDRAARAARSFGVRLGLGPRNRYEAHLVTRAADAVAIIERIGSEMLFIHLDTFHMATEEEGFATALRRAEPFLGYVTLSESHRGVPGTGMLDWPAAMAAIAEIGYRGPLTLFCPIHVDLQAAQGQGLWKPRARDPRQLLEEGIPFLREQAGKAGVSLD